MSMAGAADQMEAIVLAGGFGTRLQKVLSDVPKPMAPMDESGKPFLAYLLQELAHQQIRRVVLSVGYLGDLIQKYFGDNFAGMEIQYSVEDSPFGTGGAVKMALGKCQAQDIFVLNGDTFFDVDLLTMLARHRKQNSVFTLAAHEMHDVQRYGTLDLAEDGQILAFKEKSFCQHGYINGGVYCISSLLGEDMPAGSFSLEHDFMEKRVQDLRMYAFISKGYFIDIGIPEDYEKAKEYFADISWNYNK